jgi:prepilin peptidase CpaA
MFPLAPFVAVVLAVVTSIAAGTDIQERRIPNWLVGSTLLVGFALNGFLYGMPGFRNAGLGLGMALLIYLPLYVLRAMGAGDVKLMAAIGALTGPGHWMRIFFLTALLGGLAALVLIASRGSAGRALRNLGLIAKNIASGHPPYHNAPELDVTSGAGLSLPHGAVIALGAFLYIFTISF